MYVLCLGMLVGCHKTSSFSAPAAQQTNCAVDSLSSVNTLSSVGSLSKVIVKNYGDYKSVPSDQTAVLKLLKGHVLPESISATPIAPMPQDTSYKITVRFELTHEEKLHQFLVNQQDPSHPDYQKVLTAEEFHQKFHIPTDTLNQVAKDLSQSGMQFLS